MEKTSFSNDNSLALKGVAIIMMMFHHCFRTFDMFKGYEVSFFPFTQDFIIDVSAMFKICVSFFVFITGYGLTLSLKKTFDNYEWNNSQITKWTTTRLIKLLSGFWFVAILSYIICEVLSGKTTKTFFDDGICLGVVRLFLNFFGVSELFGTPNFDSSWWYMSIAVLYVVTLPIFLRCFKRYSYVLVLIVVIALPRVIGWDYVNSSYFSFLLILLIGAIFAENDFMVKIVNIRLCKNKYLNKAIKFVLESIVLVVLVRFYFVLPQSRFWEIKYAIIPCYIILYLYEFILDIPALKNVLEFFGKHSMNIFLVHQIIRKDYLRSFIYSFEYFVVIGIVLLVLSLIASVIIEILKKVTRYDLLIDKFVDFTNQRILNVFFI